MFYEKVLKLNFGVGAMGLAVFFCFFCFCFYLFTSKGKKAEGS